MFNLFKSLVSGNAFPRIARYGALSFWRLRPGVLLLSVLFSPDDAGLPAASVRPSIHPAWVLVVAFSTRAAKHGFIRGHPLLTERAFKCAQPQLSRWKLACQARLFASVPYGLLAPYGRDVRQVRDATYAAYVAYVKGGMA